MRKSHYLLAASIIIFVLIMGGCTFFQKEGPVACTLEAKICPDGTAVSRVGPDCEFEACPSDTVSVDKCDYEEDFVRKYHSQDQDVCSRTNFACEPSRKPFFDECGCGCELKEDADSIQTKVACQPEERLADACIEIYQPVCGWFEPEKIKCVTFPCAQTFSNTCFACLDENVAYWTEGECPEPDVDLTT